MIETTDIAREYSMPFISEDAISIEVRIRTGINMTYPQLCIIEVTESKMDDKEKKIYTVEVF